MMSRGAKRRGGGSPRRGHGAKRRDVCRGAAGSAPSRRGRSARNAWAAAARRDDAGGCFVSTPGGVVSCRRGWVLFRVGSFSEPRRSFSRARHQRYGERWRRGGNAPARQRGPDRKKQGTTRHRTRSKKRKERAGGSFLLLLSPSASHRLRRGAATPPPIIDGTPSAKIRQPLVPRMRAVRLHLHGRSSRPRPDTEKGGGNEPKEKRTNERRRRGRE